METTVLEGELIEDAGQALALREPHAGRMVLAEDTRKKAQAILDGGTAPATLRAMLGDLAYFWAWALADAKAEEVWPVPVSLVLKFITDHLEGLPELTESELLASGAKSKQGPHSVRTVDRRIQMLSAAHRAQGIAEDRNPCRHPQVRLLLSKARRRAASRGEGPRKKKAATDDILQRMAATCGADLVGLRDRALLFFAFASGGRRRSEVSAAQIEDLEPAPGGFLFHLRRSKTDQLAEGSVKPVLGEAAEALQAWIVAAAIVSGPLFRSVEYRRVGTSALGAKSVSNIVKARAALIGEDPAAYGGHSLRSGFMTTCDRRGYRISDAMQLSGHRSVSVAMGYMQSGTILSNPAGRTLG